jgi:predicted tellurium resistance membrane protein TerC
MIEFLTNPDTWLSLLTLTMLEIILGIDNLVFLTIASNNLPPHKQKLARKVGLLFAVISRLALLASLYWLAGLTTPWFTLFGQELSGRDLILIGGGLFLLVKGTKEIHSGIIQCETGSPEEVRPTGKYAKFWSVIVQIMILDIIFSLDSVITAVGMTRQFSVMAAAIIIAVLAMLFASEPLSRLINKYMSLKMLALSFLLLVGVVLIADGLDFHIPRGYVYFAMLFSLSVEALSIFASRYKKSG